MVQARELTGAALPFLVMLFMAGNLASVGLELDFRAALAPLRNVRFVVVVLLCDWLLCPGVAFLLVKLVPMAKPYALGLLLIGMSPAAPFLPTMVRRARGDLAYAAAFMLVAAISTVAVMPLALPLLAPDFPVDTWTIARPLILLLLAPLILGLSVRAVLPSLANAIRGGVKLMANLATLAMLAAVLILFFDGFVGAVGSFAIGAQLLFAFGTMVAAYALSAGLRPEQKRVVSLGVCTRNLGAALAPLLAASTDARATIMVAMAVPITLIATAAAARWFERHRQQQTADVPR